ncbi:MAG: hypothetical protein AAFY76_18955, partial [Cyanobacteria bacterium J06649_11]
MHIYEFSTGLNTRRTNAKEGTGFISHGFSGKYSNNTFPNQKIPQIIEDSISSEKFAANQMGSGPENAAVIGRYIPGKDGQLGYGVIAVISTIEDEKGRNASVYRYFACPDIPQRGEGSGLNMVTKWLEDYRQTIGTLPTVRPFSRIDAVTVLKGAKQRGTAVGTSYQDGTLIPLDRQNTQSNIHSNRPLIM